ncbi:MAG: carboxymuconolactone decarboxylase family protein [candidate division Zixibacteria bacterium]|jgi:AhpD family alkylhydroperoxidase|nr:carboxymuconolactone decarboxylase family protein [candidate division Zixibacteria bacterium]
MGDRLERFKTERERLNKLILSTENTHIKRFFTLDNAVYSDGALSTRVKEMMGLVASAVLRCDDCISYHVDRCFEEGVTRAEFDELISIILVVGGSITIPHVRRAYDLWAELEQERRRNTV